MANLLTTKVQQLTPIIEGKLLKRIPYMDQPPAMGGKLTYLSHEEFYKKFNCYYYEGIKKEQADHIIPTFAMFRGKDVELDTALERLKNPLNSLVICNMGEPLGHGLFALEDIGIGTVLCIYSGAVGATATFSSLFSEYGLGNLNAKEIGGISRFMQHMPLSKTDHAQYLLEVIKGKYFFPLSANSPNTTTECQQYLRSNDHIYDFDKIIFKDDKIKDQIATSNVVFNTVKIREFGIQFVIMCAMRNIKKHEVIGFSYGLDYWKNPQVNCQPLLFTPEGQIITPEGNYSYPEMPIKPEIKLMTKLFDGMKKTLINQETNQTQLSKNEVAVQSISSSVKQELKVEQQYASDKQKDMIDTAIAYVPAATTNGNVQLDLGFMYMKKKNYIKAKACFEKAATHNNANAQYNLGYLYHYGLGVSQNDVQAKNWYEKAANNGCDAAQEQLRYLQGMMLRELFTPMRGNIIGKQDPVFDTIDKMAKNHFSSIGLLSSHGKINQDRTHQQNEAPTVISKKQGEKNLLEINQILKNYDTTDMGKAFRRVAGFGAIDELALLLEADPSVLNSAGIESKKTALHIATENNKEENIEFLLLLGADPTLLDANGKLAQEYAIKAKNEKCKKSM